MRGFRFLWFCLAAGLLLGVPLSGQSGMETTSPADASHEQTHLGYPEDWSSRHLLMPGMRAEDVLAAGAAHDPRYVYNMVMRQVAVERSRPREPLRPRHCPAKPRSTGRFRSRTGTCPRTSFRRNTSSTWWRRTATLITLSFGLTVTGTRHAG